MQNLDIKRKGMSIKQALFVEGEGGSNCGRSGGKKRRMKGMSIIKALHIHMNENNIVKPITIVFKRGKGVRKSNRG
jgi:hypothetical protein